MLLPAEKSTLRIEPMQLVVGKGHFATRILDLLRLKDRCESYLIIPGLCFSACKWTAHQADADGADPKLVTSSDRLADALR